MIPAGTTTTSSAHANCEHPLKRRLTVYFEEERVQRIENQGVPTQTDLDQLEQDLQRAIAANKKNRKGAQAAHAAEGASPRRQPTGYAATGTYERTREGGRGSGPIPFPPPTPLPAPVGTPSGQP